MKKMEFNNVTKCHFTSNDSQPVHALDNVSFKVEESELFCIIGPSGCGKSTIINLMAGFIYPDKGKILVDGIKVKGTSANRTIVFQEFGLFPWKTVEGNIEFGLKYVNIEKDERKKIIKNFINLVRLNGFEKRYPHELSGGMKQRLSIARAWAINPDIILMDEPFGSLDQQTRDILQEELLSVKSKNAQTILFVTHDIDEAIFLGDHVLIMSDRPGKVKELLTINIPRPRKIEDRSSPEFLKIKEKIGRSIREGIK